MRPSHYYHRKERRMESIANAISNMIHSCFMLEMPKLPFETVHTINLLARCGDLSRHAVLRVGPRTLKL